MQQEQRLAYLFVINHRSGTDSNIDYAAEIKKFLHKENAYHENAIMQLDKKIDAIDLKKEIKKINPLKLVALGGDGTVTLLANIAAGTDMVLGIIPGGSANGMAKELNIPEDFFEALEIIKTGEGKPVDMIEISGHNYCLHMSDIGLNAHLIKYFDEGNLRGKLGYGLVILKTLWHKTKMQITICTNEVEVKTEAFMVALANAQKYGTGAVINPEGKLDDGIFEIIIVKKLAFGALLKMLLKPGRFNTKNIEILPCTSVTLNSKHAMPFQVDGEYKGKLKSVEAVIAKAAVRVILPLSNL